VALLGVRGGLMAVPANGSVQLLVQEFLLPRQERRWRVRFVVRVIVTAIGLAVATWIVSGIRLTGSSTWANIGTLVLVAVIFGLVNATIKPVVKILGCLFYIVTLGLIAVFVNALLFLLVNWLAGLLRLPFHVDGFWSAFWGAIIVGIVSWVINLAIPEPKE
jgi:putative membrane protein